MKQDKTSCGRQRGIAAILILVLVGLSLTATMLGSVHYLRASQEQHTVLHAQSIAQARVWTAAEALRRYFEEVAQEGEWESFAASLVLPQAVTINLDDNSIEASLIELGGTPTKPLITAHLVGKAAQGSRAESASVLEVVYVITPGAAGSNDNVVTFNRDLTLGGGIEVESEPDRRYELNVRGNLLTSGNSIVGISIIRATESIDIGSGSSFDELYANGDIRLTGSVSGQQNLQARGNICLDGGASAMGQVKANGTVIGDGGVRFGDISSLGTADEHEGRQLCVPPALALDADGQLYGVDLRGNSSADRVRSKASVRLNSGSIGDLRSEGHLVVTSWGGSVGSGRIGGEFTHPSPAETFSSEPGLVVPISPVPVVSLNTVDFNAYDLKQDANYAFWVDTSGYRMVTVKDVNGAEDGDYYLGRYDPDWSADPSSGSYRDRLCQTLRGDSSPNDPRCGGILADSVSVCRRTWLDGGCFTYDPDKKTWEVNVGGPGQGGIAQGILWFEGGLNAGNGHYYNTFIATGDIVTSGNHQTTAPNYAGYARQVGYGLDHGMCTDLVIASYYPTQLCQGGSYDFNAAGGLGNYALMAGSCDQGQADACQYQGGNITTGASSVIRGAIKAGNEFISGGSSTIYGYITALALGEERVNSSMGGSTRIILKDLPPGYDPAGGGGGSGNPSINASAIIQWSRYL